MTSRRSLGDLLIHNEGVRRRKESFEKLISQQERRKVMEFFVLHISFYINFIAATKSHTNCVVFNIILNYRIYEFKSMLFERVCNRKVSSSKCF